MFEGKLPKAPLAQDLGAQAGGMGGDCDSLRPMTWSDLRARLEAARDFRAAMLGGDEDGLACFDAHSAKHIAAHANGKDAVNPEDLANRKGSGPNDSAMFDIQSDSEPRT